MKTIKLLEKIGILNRFDWDDELSRKNLESVLKMKQAILPPGHLEIAITERELAFLQLDAGNIIDSNRLSKNSS